MNCEISAADSFSEKVMQHNIVSSQFPFDMIFFRKKRAEAGKNELKQEFHNMGKRRDRQKGSGQLGESGESY